MHGKTLLSVAHLKYRRHCQSCESLWCGTNGSILHRSPTSISCIFGGKLTSEERWRIVCQPLEPPPSWTSAGSVQSTTHPAAIPLHCRPLPTATGATTQRASAARAVKNHVIVLGRPGALQSANRLSIGIRSDDSDAATAEQADDAQR